MQLQKFLHIVVAVVATILLSLTLVSSAWAAEYKVLHKFRGGDDGRTPTGVILDSAGNLYGTTTRGGLHGHGTVFRLQANPDGTWTESVLYSFTGGNDGSGGAGPPVFDTAGNLYGATGSGGTNTCDYHRHHCGTVFKLKPKPDGSWKESVLYNFAGGQDGEYPNAPLIFDTAGNLYGTTEFGGPAEWGTVFQLSPHPDGSWTETILHGFDYSEGMFNAGLIFDPVGDLYGITQSTVFELLPNPDKSWTKKILYGTGETYADLILDPDGNLYFTTAMKGAYGDGAVWKLTPGPDGNWSGEVIHSFAGRPAMTPRAGVIRDAAGNLYGTTNGSYSPPITYGTVFKLAPNPDGTWMASKLHKFSGREGARPGPLIMDKAGNLYGTTYEGGHGYGVVFKITP